MCQVRPCVHYVNSKQRHNISRTQKYVMCANRQIFAPYSSDATNHQRRIEKDEKKKREASQLSCTIIFAFYSKPEATSYYLGAK